MARRIHARWAGLLLGVVAGGASAQSPGDFDVGWRPGGRIIVAASGATLFVPRVIAPIDGRLLVAGSCSSSSNRQGCAFRLGADGNIDGAYGDPFALNNIVRSDLAGINPLPNIPGLGFIADVDATGRVIFVTQTMGSPVRVGRLNAAGSAASGAPVTLDLWLGGGGDQYIAQVAADGAATWVAATVDLDGNNQDLALARLGPDLQLDPAFNGTGVRRVGFDAAQATDDAMQDITVAPDGRVFAVAEVRVRGAAQRDYWVLCFNPDGSLDPGFGVGGRTQVPIPRATSMFVAVDDLGRVVLAGSYQFAGSDFDAYVARLTPEGQFDTTFGLNGISLVPVDAIAAGGDFAQAVAIQPDNRIVVTGFAQSSTTTTRLFIAQLNESGGLNSAFGVNGRVVGSFGTTAGDAGSDTASTLAFDADGRLYVAGGNSSTTSTTVRVGVARIVSGFAPDPVFEDGFE